MPRSGPRSTALVHVQLGRPPALNRSSASFSDPRLDRYVFLGILKPLLEHAATWT